MDAKPFSKPIPVHFDAAEAQQIDSTEAALALLENLDWPRAGPRHRDAVETCMKVLEGYRSTVDAETAFTQAAREAGILVEST